MAQGKVCIYCEVNLKFFLLYETMYNILCRHIGTYMVYRSTHIYVRTYKSHHIKVRQMCNTQLSSIPNVLRILQMDKTYL